MLYRLEERTEITTDVLEDGTVVVQTTVYYVAIPLPLETVYENLAAWQGEPVTEEDKANAAHIYSMVVGSTGGDTFDGSYTPGGGSGVELDISDLTSPASKNAANLVAYVTNAWKSGWGYVWGTYGQVLTPELFQYKLTQYPEGVGQYADFIRNNWLGKHTADCVGLIKGYGWLSPDTMTIDYGTNRMPDIGANQMYYNATRKGTIDTIPEVPGLAVWKSGHIGVYIGDGQVIEAMGTKYGVVKTRLQGRGWTHWLEIPYINYDYQENTNERKYLHIRKGNAAGFAGKAGTELSGLHCLAANFDVRTDAGQDKRNPCGAGLLPVGAAQG